MFQCYLDDSGTSGLPVVTMAGFVAPTKTWKELEPELDSILSGHEIQILHAKEFQDTKPPFKGWNKVRKRSFADELFSASHGLLYGLSVTIGREKFNEAKLENSAAFSSMSPIGVCFSSIMIRIVTDPQIGIAAKNDGVCFLIESGNKNNSEIEKHFHRMAKAPAFEGCLQSISFIPKSSCRAIQLADFIAFYSRRRMRNNARFDGKFILPPCPYLDIIHRHGPIWMQGGFGKPKDTGGHLEKNLPNHDALVALTRKPS
jgi:hypothetical protein